MRSKLLLVFAALGILVAGLVYSGAGEETEAAPPTARGPVPLASPEATVRDYKQASDTERARFVESYTATHLGPDEPVGVRDLKRYLDTNLGALPAGGDLMRAAMGRTSLQTAAAAGAHILGWPGQ